MNKVYDDSKVDWKDFNSIFQYAIQYWPDEVELSTDKDEFGRYKGFDVFTFDDTIDEPYFDSGMSRHIVRHMLWAMFCGLPKNKNGRYNVKTILDMNKVRKKFESSIRDDFEDNYCDREEKIYADANKLFS